MPVRLVAAGLSALALFGCARPGSADAASAAVFLGVGCGIGLAALLLFGVWVCLRPTLGHARGALRNAVLLLLALWAIKTVLLTLFPGFGPDIGSYQSWALEMAARGPAGIYRPGYFLDYPPGYLYPLWLAGEFARWFHLTGSGLRILVETPALAADFLLALLIFGWLRAQSGTRAGWLAALLFALNPALLFDTVVWGQSDSWLALTMMLAALLVLQRRYFAGFALAALACLVKPQAVCILPVLALWSGVEGGWRACGRGLAGFAVALALCALPFQLGHGPTWLPSLYLTTAGYYHETSVNAFNLMALLGGLRVPDVTPVMGIASFHLGMALLVPLYGLVGVVVMRRRDRRGFFFALFLATLGFFMLAPRMHERYLYPALVFALPLAAEETAVLWLFGLLSAAFLFNLAYVKHALETTVFLSSRDALAMTAAFVNVALFALAGLSAFTAGAFRLTRQRRFGQRPVPGERRRAFQQGLQRSLEALRQSLPTWNTADTVTLTVLLGAAALTRFWRLGRPPEIVFDEVHFVNQARHYLLGESFLDPHPPLAKLVTALGIELFGDRAFGWRIGNSLIGTLLVGVTYLLGRRIFASRLAGALAAVFVLSDGLFLVDSRVAVIDIVYLTFAACAYLALFRFVQARSAAGARGALLLAGLSLGLCLGAKLYVPAFTFLLVVGFGLLALRCLAAGGDFGPLLCAAAGLRRRAGIGLVLLVGSVGASAYLAAFLPHYLWGWWGGASDLVRYYGQVIWYERSVASALHPYASPWWSWPLMLRPVAYWDKFPQTGDVAAVWGGGNPLLWWAVLPAIAAAALRAYEEIDFSRLFVVAGYLVYLAIWVPIGRTLFIYHYMASLYLGFLALGDLLARCWRGNADFWEQAGLLLSMAVVPPLALGPLWGGAGAAALLAAGFVGVRTRPSWSARMLCVAFMLLATALFFYFAPLWYGLPISRAAFYRRMWFKGPGIENWI